MVHDNMCADMIVCCAFLGNFRHLIPGKRILERTGIQIVRVHAALLQHVFVVIKSYAGFGRRDGIQLTVICALLNCRRHKIGHGFLIEVFRDRQNDLICRIIGNLRTVHIEDRRQIIGCHGSRNFIVISIRIGTVNCFAAHLNIRMRFVPLCKLLNPPCLNGFSVRRAPDCKIDDSIIRSCRQSRKN